VEKVDPNLLKLIALHAVTVIVGLIVILLLGVAAMTMVRVWEWPRLLRNERRRRWRQKFRPDGRPYPPSAAGLCDECQQAFEKVYYMPTGRRLCPDCYNRVEPIEPAEPVPEGHS